MSGRMSRNKGARGQSEFKAMLLDRDWAVDTLSAGIQSADLIATDPQCRTWLVEVKNVAGIIPAHKKQAIEQGKARRMPWLLASKIAGSSSWLIQRQGELPQVWHAKGQCD